MKKIIKNKMYDTSTAHFLGCKESGAPGTFSYECESLYQKRTGEFFLHGEGGPMSRYAERIDSNNWSGGEMIIPLDYEQAKAWAENHLDAEAYEDIFGKVIEDDSRRMLTLSLSASTVDTVRQIAAQRGVSISSLVESLILSL